MIVNSDEDIKNLKVIGSIVANCLKYMLSQVRPGMKTSELDSLGAAFLAKYGARSAPQLVYNFPGATCISMGHEVAHGIPGSREILLGDLINIDVSAELNGYFGDTGGSMVVPPIKKPLTHLCEATKEAMYAGIAAARAGVKLNEIGKAVEKVARKNGYKVIVNLGSHGVGRGLHEEPKFIPSYFDPADTRVLKKGQVITIEPFLTTGTTEVIELEDGWTLAVSKKHRAAQYEHTIIITDEEPMIMTEV